MHQNTQDNLEQVSKPTGLNSVGFSAFCVSLPAISFNSSVPSVSNLKHYPNITIQKLGGGVTFFTGRSQYTSLKQKHFEYILNTHIEISKQVQKNNPWMSSKYFYADICAGDGGNDVAGSPVIFTKAQNHHGINCKPYFIDHNALSLGRLKRIVENDSAIFLCDNHADVIPKIVPRQIQMGLVYFDPNGDPFNNYPLLLSNFYSHMSTKRIDCLLYFSATTIKRVFNAPGTNRKWGLIDDMKRIDKKVWLIREPFGRSQWSFLFGTNYTDFPEFKKLGLHNITSRRGQSVLTQLNYTSRQIKEMKMKIFQMPKQLDLFGNNMEVPCL